MHLTHLLEGYRSGGELHHACLIEGSHVDLHDELIRFLEDDVSFQTKGNPDFHFLEYDTFGIDDTRDVQRFAIQKPLKDIKVFVFAFKSITSEAQNALLKLFEDPTARTHFFLITTNAESLLPTLRSRLYIVPKVTKDIGVERQKEAKEFLMKSKGERLLWLKNVVEEKDKERMQEFLSSLETVLYTKLKNSKKDKGEIEQALKEVLRSEQYIKDRSSSPKLLLEHVALVTPKL